MAEVFDAQAKEAELQAEAAAWDTTAPQPAQPGDVPIVDVSDWFASGDPDALNAAGAALRVACEQVGFHQLVGHGIAPTETKAILDANHQFHALDIDTKSTIRMDRPDFAFGGAGWLGYDNHKLPSRETPNQNAAFVIKRDRGVGFDDNQWLPENAVPGFRVAVERYAKLIERLALRLLPVYANALELDSDFFAPAFDDPFWRLRLTHYPATAEAPDSFGISPHVDTTFFTLLLTDGPGLNIFSHLRSEWIQVPIAANALVVNSGELLRQWSNDRFLSTRHFAVNPRDHDRYSVPFFFNANADHRMECLPSCHGPDNPPKYPPFSYNESQGVVQGE